MTFEWSDLGGLVSRITDFYISISASPTWQLAALLASIALASITAIRAVYALKSYRLKKLVRKLDALRESGSLIRSFQDADFESAVRDYVEPYCSNIDPAGLDDLRNTVSVRQKVFETMDAELSRPERNFILVLADSGMGKTTLFLNMVAMELKKNEKNRRRMALVPLGQPGALKQISDIEDQRNTILLLDAYDEDSRAISHTTERMSELIEAAANYRSVVMTCRTQFFESDYALPGDTGLKRVAGRRAGEPIIYIWRTLYLQPFDATQIDYLIRRSIPIYRPRQRKKARLITSKIHDLAARPMLTALIPELSRSSKSANGLWDLYVFMVDSWLTRESSWIKPSQLRRLSQKLAVNLVVNRERRGGERISPQELVHDLDLTREAVMSWNMTGRSLLNRDAVGSIKFAHRSIMEFLFVWSFIEGENACAEVPWTNLMKEFLVSWGGSSSHDHRRAQEFFEMDLRKTQLFPCFDRKDDELVVDKSTSKVNQSSLATGQLGTWPENWWPLTSRIVEKDGVLRIYDFVRGAVWQVVATSGIQAREERDVHRERYVQAGQNPKSGTRWDATDLHHFLCLLDILGRMEKLFTVMDSREMYWVSNSGTSMQARVRSESDSPIPYPHLAALTTLSLEFPSSQTDALSKVSVDLYRSPESVVGSGPPALRVSLAFTNAEELWFEDRLSNTSWSIETAKKSILSSSPANPTISRH